MEKTKENTPTKAGYIQVDKLERTTLLRVSPESRRVGNIKHASVAGRSADEFVFHACRNARKKWVLRRHGSKKAIKLCGSMLEAIEEFRKLEKDEDAKLVLHRSDGAVLGVLGDD